MIIFLLSLILVIHATAERIVQINSENDTKRIQFISCNQHIRVMQKHKLWQDLQKKKKKGVKSDWWSQPNHGKIWILYWIKPLFNILATEPQK